MAAQHPDRRNGGIFVTPSGYKPAGAVSLYGMTTGQALRRPPLVTQMVTVKEPVRHEQPASFETRAAPAPQDEDIC